MMAHDKGEACTSSLKDPISKEIVESNKGHKERLADVEKWLKIMEETLLAMQVNDEHITKTKAK